MNLDIIQKIDRIHPYPAKFTVDLALEYINKYSKEGDTIYDPFVGSGTTLLASSLLHRYGYGTDINHIAVLISKGKLLSFSKDEIAHLRTFIEEFDNGYKDTIHSIPLYEYPSINHWFCDNAIRVLSFIKYKLNEVKNENERIFIELVVSAIINTVSNQESDTRYAAIEKPDLTIEKIASIFSKKYYSSLAMFERLGEEKRWCKENEVFLLDSKHCQEKIAKESVDLILTSPPYINTYDYYLYHKHRMNWLGYNVKFSMDAEIGSRREFSSQKHKESKFSDDLYQILNSCNEVLKPGGTAVLVMGDGQVAGKLYDSKENMIEICTKIGWKLIDYSYTLLDDTSRSFQKSYRTKGKKEHILVFRKEK